MRSCPSHGRTAWMQDTGKQKQKQKQTRSPNKEGVFPKRNGSAVKSRQRLLTGTLCHTSQQPPSLGGHNPFYKTRSLKTRGLQYVI